ncbi:MAG: efflux transporter periplasmic adaptor subunit [Flavobacteriia bacterium 40-80]|uniref:efflux RND transporter periplasmic adaptor subunit n=1 Tax=uncultured Flavobacterium sp. TaxID=165435 RepID=UPI000963C63C|nr:efflux RND transporter periplasmic adaptor subunit [uncultured Flavobacterium sp.]OJX36268.1 MAG: efflux transporter periplasmic adaptor subunit [Flavobacteriia bacterium 40-80]
MKFKSYKIRTGIGMVFLALLITACGGHSEGDGHNHGSKEEHEEGESNTTSLTQEQIKAVGITFGEIEQKQLTATIKANGILRVPNNFKANATTLYGGVIKTLNVEFGDHVKKGQIIATVSNPQFIQLQEEYLTINSQIVLAEAEMKRQQELADGNAGAKRNLQNATAELNTLRTRQASLKQQLELMGINVGSVTNSNMQSALIVRSPINGTISNIFAKIGSYVDVSSPIAEIVDNNSLHLDLQVFEKDLQKISVGQTIDFTLTNNPVKTYKAKVFSIGSSFENSSKTIAVHSEVLGDKSGLIDGMNSTAMISINDVTMPAVPNEAIVEADGKYYIFIRTAKPNDGHDHNHEEGDHDHQEDGHSHDHGDKGHAHSDGDEHLHDEEHNHDEFAADKGDLYFKKIEVAKGVSNMGYTAITPVTDLPHHAQVVVKGAFFINAKMNNTGEEGHAH